MGQRMTERRLVLAVDDAPDILFLVHKLAERAGYAFVGAGSGAECLTLAERRVPSFILLDVQMPEMTGYETARRLRQNPSLAQVPIGFLTARKTVEDVVEGINAGGNDFIIKPFDGDRLIERIRHWIAREA